MPVSWNESIAFANWLSKSNKGKYSFGLPTEAQWEYSCRAGTKTPYYFGNRINKSQVNYDGNNTTPVGKYPPNSFGLYDMHGNAWEWCKDWFGQYNQAVANNPIGPSTGSARVLRGGSWNGSARDCRSANRYGYEPGERYGSWGLRLALPRGHQVIMPNNQKK